MKTDFNRITWAAILEAFKKANEMGESIYITYDAKADTLITFTKNELSDRATLAAVLFVTVAGVVYPVGPYDVPIFQLMPDSGISPGE